MPTEMPHTAVVVLNPQEIKTRNWTISDARAILANKLANEIGKQMAIDLSILVDDEGLFYASATWIDEINPPEEE